MGQVRARATGSIRSDSYSSLNLPHGFGISPTFRSLQATDLNITTGRDTNKDGFYSERPAFASNPNKLGVIITPYGALDPINRLAGGNIIREISAAATYIGMWTFIFQKCSVSIKTKPIRTSRASARCVLASR